MIPRCKLVSLILVFAVCVSLSFGAQDVTIYRQSSGPIDFAVEQMKSAGGKDFSITFKSLSDLPANADGSEIVIASADAASALATLPESVRKKIGDLVPQGYIIRRVGNRIWVIGGDESGAMYGGMDIAEAMRIGTFDTLADSDHAPYIAQRGIKFNIPLDLRTPSYSDCSDAFQANIPEMWSMDFWRAFLDAMATHRFNVLTLWNLHPFPSIVKVPEFPDVALADVWRTKMPFDDSFSHSGSDMLRPAMLQGCRGSAADDHRRKDRLLAAGHAVRPRSRHRGLLVHLEHVHLRRRGQARHQAIADRRNDHRLFPRVGPRADQDLSAAGRYRHHRRRAARRPQG